MNHDQEKICDIEILSTESLSQSKYVTPMRLKYKQAGKEKIWDYIVAHNSVAILLYNTSSKSFVLVKQFRPPVYMTNCAMAKDQGNSSKVAISSAVTIELCAGLIDREDTPENIAVSEVFEETGYKIKPENLELIQTFRSGVGLSGGIQWLYYAEITDEMKVSSGGGSAAEGEMINLFHVKLEDVQSFIFESTNCPWTSGLLLGFTWFLLKKGNQT